GSFVPLLRVEQMRAEDRHSPLAEKLERDAEVTFPPVLHQRLNVIEQELRKNQLSDDTLQFLNSTGLKAENLALWLEPEPESDRQIHLYHCDHLGTPLALVSTAGSVDWHITLDPWGNVLSEHNPQKLHQPLRMQGQQYDEESGLHYNRHRYYDPLQGRYITQDPIGLAGGWNVYSYPLNPLQGFDPRGLNGLGIFVSQPGIQTSASGVMSDSMDNIDPPVSLRPDGKPWGAGCGDVKTDAYVPDVLYGVDFAAACQTHDECYGELGKNKAICDTQLGNNIALACDNQLHGIPHSEEVLPSCHMAAGIYQSAVKNLGGPAYEAAQKAATVSTK
ncbi:RHS repeat-associated core domain-containing protein, partial [Buttiauxella izardii]